MGFLDKLKGAVNAVTGGAARVAIEVNPNLVFPGDTVAVRITVTSTGPEIKSKGVFVDVQATEEVRVRDDKNQEISRSKVTTDQSFQIAPALTLAPNEGKTFEGTFQFPAAVLPTYNGAFAKHQCYIRGRLEAFGNDPDSGFLPIRVGSRS